MVDPDLHRIVTARSRAFVVVDDVVAEKGPKGVRGVCECTVNESESVGVGELIDVAIAAQVDAMIAHVRNVKGRAVSELVLHADMVLVRRWTIVRIAEGENSSGRLRRAEIERSERRKRAARHIRNDVAGQLLAKRTGLRQRVASSEDAEAAADHQVFHRLWLPRDADARLKIPIMVWKRGTVAEKICARI